MKMFDPIVFDNLKVVVEGEVYELDLEGRISVVNREDYIDLARFTRVYRISFQQASKVIASLQLMANIEHIHAEISGNKKVRPGCLIEISFLISKNTPFTDEECDEIREKVRHVWGADRIIEQRVTRLIGSSEYTNRVDVKFNRYIYEDQVEDIIEMVDYMLETIQKLRISK